MTPLTRRMIALVSLVLFLVASRPACADREPISVDVVVVSPFDRNPVAVSITTNGYVEARPTLPALEEEMRDQYADGNVEWSYTFASPHVDGICSVGFTSDPNSHGTFWGATVSAYFSVEAYYVITVAGHLTFDYPHTDGFDGTGYATMDDTAYGYAPKEIISTGNDGGTVFPRNKGHETVYTMVVHDNADPMGFYGDGTPKEEFLNINPPGVLPNGRRGGDTWAQGWTFSDHIWFRFPRGVQGPNGSDPVNLEFDQRWHDIRVANPADNANFKLNTQHITVHDYSDTRS